jgi:hypothetical protein
MRCFSPAHLSGTRPESQSNIGPTIHGLPVQGTRVGLRRPPNWTVSDRSVTRKLGRVARLETTYVPPDSSMFLELFPDIFNSITATIIWSSVQPCSPARSRTWWAMSRGRPMRRANSMKTGNPAKAVIPPGFCSTSYWKGGRCHALLYAPRW